MKELNLDEINSISGGKKKKPNFLNFIGGAIFGGITEGFLGFFTGGPAGSTIKEAGQGLAELD